LRKRIIRKKSLNFIIGNPYITKNKGAGFAKENIKEDTVLSRLRGIAGAEWTMNDPAILVAYSNDPFPLSRRG
jgi:hypothetical protein